MDKFNDATEDVLKATGKFEAAKNKFDDAEKALKELEPHKENEVPARKGSKSPKQKYEEQLEKVKKCIADLDELKKKLEAAKEKAAAAELVKDVFVPSETCKKELIKIAVRIRWNREEEIDSREMRKGRAVEDESIRIYSDFMGEWYENNKQQLTNDMFSGELDIPVLDAVGDVDCVDDIKNRYTIFSFEEYRDKQINKKEKYQLFTYSDLTGAKRSAIANILANNDFDLIMDEIRKEIYKTPPSQLSATGDLRQVDVIKVASRHIFDRMAFIEFLKFYGFDNLDDLISGDCKDIDLQIAFDMFTEVDLEDRVIRVEQQTDYDEIEAMRIRGEECRGWLAKHYNIHHVDA